MYYLFSLSCRAESLGAQECDGSYITAPQSIGGSASITWSSPALLAIRNIAFIPLAQSRNRRKWRHQFQRAVDSRKASSSARLKYDPLVLLKVIDTPKASDIGGSLMWFFGGILVKQGVHTLWHLYWHDKYPGNAEAPSTSPISEGKLHWVIGYHAGLQSQSFCSWVFLMEQSLAGAFLKSHFPCVTWEWNQLFFEVMKYLQFLEVYSCLLLDERAEWEGGKLVI